MVGVSFIQTVKRPNLFYPETDWVFFSSPQSIRYYLEDHPVVPKRKYGVVGKRSTEILTQYGLIVNFVAKGNDTQQSAKGFVEVLQDETVLFPSSNISLKTFEQFVPEHQKVSLVTYDTNEVGKKVEEAFGAILFTSPSNVRGYFLKNDSLPSKVIALGKKTMQEIKNYSSCTVDLPSSFSVEAIRELF